MENIKENLTEIIINGINPYIIPGLAHIPSDLDIILGIVCRAAGIRREEVIPKRGKKETVVVRQAYCYFARKYTKHSLALIGKTIKRDHATVLHHIGMVDDLLDAKDNMMTGLVNKVFKLLNP